MPLPKGSSTGRVGGGAGSSRGASMRGSAPRPAPKPKPATTYHGTSWKYKPGDVTKSSSATTSYRTAARYASSGRAGRGPWLPGTGPSPKAQGKPTVYRVTPAEGKATTSSRPYRTTKKEVNSPSGWKIEGKAKPPQRAVMRAEKKGSEGPKKSVPRKKKSK